MVRLDPEQVLEVERVELRAEADGEDEESGEVVAEVDGEREWVEGDEIVCERNMGVGFGLFGECGGWVGCVGKSSPVKGLMEGAFASGSQRC